MPGLRLPRDSDGVRPGELDRIHLNHSVRKDVRRARSGCAHIIYAGRAVSPAALADVVGLRAKADCIDRAPGWIEKPNHFAALAQPEVHMQVAIRAGLSRLFIGPDQ